MATATQSNQRRKVPVPTAKITPQRCEEIFNVDEHAIAAEARKAAADLHLRSAAADKFRIAVLAIDCQIDFCQPNGKLYVQGAQYSSSRMASWIYDNTDVITTIVPTMDTHYREQIFHEEFLVDENGNHPAPFTLINTADVRAGKWRVNTSIPFAAMGNAALYMASQKHLLHYVTELEAKGKYALCIWPYHCMLGTIGHAIVPVLAEAFAFHGFARGNSTRFEIKGGSALTENYSIFAQEVMTGPNGEAIGQRNARAINLLLQHDAVFIMGQAKSHCVAWSIDDLLTDIKQRDASLAKKVYILEDCMDPVIVPGMDFTPQAEAAIARFKSEGMNVVRSTDDLSGYLPLV